MKDTSERDAEMALLQAGGATLAQLAGKYGISTRAVLYALNRATGIAPFPRKHRTSCAPEVVADRDQRIKMLTQEGCSAAEIAAILGITQRTAVRGRVRTGCDQPTVPKMTSSEIALAENMLDDGASIAEVARTLGRSPQTIQNRFPGRAWSKKEAAAHTAAVRKLGAVLQ